MGEGGWGLIVNTYVHCTHSAVIKCSQFIENDTFRTERLVHCKQLRDSDHDAVFFFFWERCLPWPPGALSVPLSFSQLDLGPSYEYEINLHSAESGRATFIN